MWPERWKESIPHTSRSMCETTWVTALHLHSTWSKNGGHPQSPVQRAAWSCGVDFNIMSRLPSAMFREAWTMYLKWSSPSRWRFKRVPDQRHLGRDRMAAAFRPGQNLTRTKKQACSRPLLLSPLAKTTPGKVCVNTATGLSVNGVCVCSCPWVVKEGHVKGAYAPENTDPNLGKHTNDHLMGFLLWTHVTCSRMCQCAHIWPVFVCRILHVRSNVLFI